MKKAIVAVGLVAIGTVGLAQVQVNLPLYEPFPSNYQEGTGLGAGASAAIWSVGNSPGTGGPYFTNIDLTYPGLNDDGGMSVFFTGIPSSNRDRGVYFGASGIAFSNIATFYFSYLLRVDAAPTTNPRVISAYRDSSGTGGGFTPSGLVLLNTNLTVSIGKVPNTYATTSAQLELGRTYLIVGRYVYVPGANNDVFDLWINPQDVSPINGFSGMTESPTLSISTGADDTTMYQWAFICRTSGPYNGGGTILIDDVRLWIPETNTLMFGLLAAGAIGLIRIMRRK